MALFEFSPAHRVLVVGGTGGIGAAICNAFLDAGCSVIATGVDDAALAGSTLKASGRLALRTLDFTDDPAVADFTATLGTLDTLVNSAGILARFKEFEVETFQRVLDVNLTGTFR
ncbi:SDR family NAD(P)-dependent oxidoreductase, partial [Verminephrobacter sp. Larva24]